MTTLRDAVGDAFVNGWDAYDGGEPRTNSEKLKQIDLQLGWLSGWDAAAKNAGDKTEPVDVATLTAPGDTE